MKKTSTNASQSKKGKYSKRLSDSKNTGRHESFRTHESFYRMLVESLADYAVFTTDKRGKISSWNNGSEYMLGYSEKEAVGASVSTLFTPKDREKLVLEKELKRALKKGSVINERYHVRKDGSTFWATGIIFLLEDAKGVPRGFTFVLQDREENKQMEKRKDDFISTATHELKTPITSMRLFAEIVALNVKKSGDTVGLKSVEQLNNQLDRLIALMDYLLDVSKIQQGRLHLEKVICNINVMLEKLIFTIQIVTPHHKIIQQGKVRKAIFADKERILQVVTNLLTNAIKYSPKGGEIIVKSTQDKSGTTVSVQDFGLGISKIEQSAVFDRFYRATSATENNIGGIGLGLYIVQKIILAHHGKTWLTSVPGKGSTFFFSLPHQKEALPTSRR